MDSKTNKFISTAKEIHNHKYDYSLTEYINAVTPVLIICPNHGQFFQTPYVHTTRRGNCPNCAYVHRAAKRRLNNDWWAYTQAKQYVHSLNLPGITAWNQFCKSGNRPRKLPCSPKTTYKIEWQGWTDWLGSNQKTKIFLDFKTARILVRAFHLRSCEEWKYFCTVAQKKPVNIPYDPKIIYFNEWISWADWLGYSSRANGALPGKLYVIQQSNLPGNVYKIGRTYRLQHRIYEHKRTTNTLISTICIFDVPNMQIAENTAHTLALLYGSKFNYYTHREYFQIDDINKFINALTTSLS